MSTDTDFNDLRQKAGPHAVKKQVDRALFADADAVFGAFTCKRGGVFWLPPAKGDTIPSAVFFCSPLRPVGLARDFSGSDFALVMEMTDPDGKHVTWPLRLEDLHRGGGEIARIQFASRGGYFGPGIRARSMFPDFVNSIMRHSKNLPRIITATACGWLPGPHPLVFVLPDGAIAPTSGGKGGETVLYTGAENGVYATSGKLAEWQQRIARYALSNRRFIFVLAACFAGPLLHLIDAEGIGLDLTGISRIGKTALFAAAASACGNPETFIKGMDATANSLEAVAALHNDGVLFLDEKGLAHPDALQRISYKTARWQKRGRADTDGNGKPQPVYRLVTVMNGEVSLSEHLATANKRTYAGQEARLLLVPADAGAGHGVYDELHGFSDGAALSDHLKQAAGRFYGVAFRVYLAELVKRLAADRAGLLSEIKASMAAFMDANVPADACGQIKSAGSRFAQLATAGELAASWGVVPWPEGESFWGVGKCFSAWLHQRGGAGLAEETAIISQVEAFLDRHGEGRFAPLDTGNYRGPARPVVNRVGWRRSVTTVTGLADGMEYLLTADGFREMTTGFSLDFATATLTRRGWLVPGDDGRHTRRDTIPGEGRRRVYLITRPTESDNDTTPATEPDTTGHEPY